jgi:L-amino acid N-acyltransferase YncA
MAPVIRDATMTDLAAVASIYAHYVLHSVATFEETPPSEAEMCARWQAIRDVGLPYHVCVDGPGDAAPVIGYAYAAPYRARTAYRFTVENSIYVHPQHVGRGVGVALLTATLEGCVRAGKKEVVAVIGGSDNTASIRLHTRAGFTHVGTLRRVGY